MIIAINYTYKERKVHVLKFNKVDSTEKGRVKNVCLCR